MSAKSYELYIHQSALKLKILSVVFILTCPACDIILNPEAFSVGLPGCQSGGFSFADALSSAGFSEACHFFFIIFHLLICFLLFCYNYSLFILFFSLFITVVAHYTNYSFYPFAFSEQTVD